MYPDKNYFESPSDKPEYAKVIWLEFMLTLNFTVIFLIVKRFFAPKNNEEILKGICMAFTFSACVGTAFGSGGSLNPALGLTQTCY